MSVGPAVPAATYDLLIRGTGTGVTAATIALALTVTVPPAFTLAATPVAINQAAQGQSTVTLTRVNFGGAVTLSLENGLRQLRCGRRINRLPRRDPSLAGSCGGGRFVSANRTGVFTP